MQANAGRETGVWYQFDSYRLDPATKTLRCGDQLIDLTPKVLSTLLVLIENRDKVLTKDELLATIWPDQFVDQSNLSQNISVLRRSLGESESGKKYIATFPGRGYRFIGPVEVKLNGEEDRVTSPPDPPSAVAEEAQADSKKTLGSSSESKGTLHDWKWKSTSVVATSILILAAIVAIGFYENFRDSKLKSTAEDSSPVKMFARMDAGLTQPSWSRNGSEIAFVARDLGGTRSAIYVQSKGDIQPRKVLSDSGQFSSPAWSPDGKFLAFLHFGPDTAELVIFDTQRQSSRVITKLFAHRYGLNYRHLAWSPDGQFLVVDDKTEDAEPFSLFLIYVDSGQRVRLTYPDSDMIGDVSPSVSADGARVAFIRDIDHFEQDVYVTSVRGRTYQRITSAHTLISDVGWKSDQILVLAADHGDGFRLWQFDLTKQDPKETPASQVKSDRPVQFSISQSGKVVAFSNYNPNLEIWSIDVSKPSKPWTPVIQAPAESIQPAISPDGKLLAFLSNASGHFQLWVSQIDGANASAVSTGPLVPASFCWSSDGKSLIFSPQRVHGLYQVPLQGDASARQISSIYTDPHSAVDGKSLFARAHFFIYRLPLPGGKAQEVTEQGGAPIAQSRDGRYLYFSQGRMSTTIARLDLRTGRQDELTKALVPGYSDAWALSSEGLFFLGQEHNQPAIKFLDFATGVDKYLADFPGDLPQVEMSGFGISPDGQRLWVVRADPMPSDIETATLTSK